VLTHRLPFTSAISICLFRHRSFISYKDAAFKLLWLSSPRKFKMFSKFPRYPRATDNRFHRHDKAVLGDRRSFLKAALINFVYLQLLFFGLFCYIFASLYKQGSHIHNFNILYVDYDGGSIGTAVNQAYKTLQGKGFPTLVEGSVNQYGTFHDIKEAVCSTKYWAAIYTSPGATNTLEQGMWVRKSEVLRTSWINRPLLLNFDFHTFSSPLLELGEHMLTIYSIALAGGSAAAEYNRSNVITYIWNEARYSAVVDSDISANLEALSSAARMEYVSANGISAMSVLSTTDDAAISVFADPWELTSVNIQPTTQGSRLIYNTLVIILILMQEFFYLGTINALYARFKIYERLYPIRIIFFRNLISVAYTFVGSLSTAGAIWAFRGNWKVNGNQFVLTWMILWLFAHANFLSLDVFTVWIPVQVCSSSIAIMGFLGG
jgi:hypothetical protein